ncbi:unnamed protein product [Nippostrongylus brasiliensis]|uniref:Signal recognition particle 14 kDa protein n=1 Tax=Nippostrongylus brasiliensis TaxID=27835 RepID=A0A158QXY3_NIPBR|nr:unnamed protein product [Nippostrongylus brasiliensis]
MTPPGTDDPPRGLLKSRKPPRSCSPPRIAFKNDVVGFDVDYDVVGAVAHKTLPHVTSQLLAGFAKFLLHFKQPFSNPKERIGFVSAFFDCFVLYGATVARICFAILQKCRKYSGVVIDELLTSEVSRSLPTLKVLLCSGELSASESVLVFRHVLANDDSNSKFLARFSEHFSWKLSTHLLLQMNPNHVLNELFDRHCELPDVSSICLDEVDYFLISDNLWKHPELVSCKNFPRSHIMLPSLLSLYTNRSELAKALPNLVPNDQIRAIKTLTAECQTVKPLGDADRKLAYSSCMTTSSYLEYVCREGNLSVFLDLWLPLIKNSVNTVLMLFSMLYAKPYFQVNRVLILNAFRYLFVSRYAITPIVNFLSIVCRQSGEVRDVSYALLRDLVTRFPSAFDVVKPLAVIGDSEPLDVLRSKLDLITALCVATDRSDELLPSISALLKKGAATVAAAMTVVKALCKEEILDVSTIRKQLGSRLRQHGFEEALAGYCDILATAASQPAEHDENFLRECVLELYEITKLRNCSAELRNARVAAWKALGSFGGALLTNVIDTSGSKLMEIFLELHEEERKGFIAFLRNLIKEEVENLSRTLYTQVHIRKSSFSALTYSLHNSLGKSNQEAPWFWKATLPLFSVIAGEYGEEAAALQATRLFRRLLREVPTSQDDVIGLFSGWRISVASMLSLHISSGSILKARDGIVEECKRALTHSELTVNNVAVVIAVLAGELRRMGSALPDSESSESFENSMRPWLIATLEFLFAIVHDDYAPTTPPLFQTVINRRCVNFTIVQSAGWMVCSLVPDKVRSFFDDEWFSSTNDWRIGAQDLFSKCSNLPLRSLQKHEPRLRKRLDQLSSRAGESMKRAIFEGLSKLASVSLLVTTVNLPADYSHLPEDSILRSCSRAISHSLLSALVGHIRSDGRRLPPLDLQFLLSSIDFRADEEARLHVLTLGFEQKDALIIFELTSSEMLCLSSTLNAYWMTLSKNISFITTALPASRAEAVLNALFRFSSEAGSEEVNEIFSQINSLGENQESVLMLILATICSTPADVPLCWPSEDIDDVMRARWRYYWKILIRVSEFCEQFDVMTAFLVACLNFEPLSPSFQDIVKGMLLDILASRPDFVKPYVYEKGFDLERLIS